VPQLNRLLSQFFWPSIDITESADYPDYSIVAVYNRWLIVGAALLDPDGYLSHFFVRPDWSGASIGTRLLQFLLHSAPPRDITLHVSATNPAMLLYNRFGFKPEQYILNHYDKWLRMAEQSEECRVRSVVLPYSRHAFLMRLRR
jgi:ribosomal protein S18 acetylase RimI-like enzyme